MDIKLLTEFMGILPSNKALLLTGEAGLGKSSFVKAYAESIGYEVVDLRLSELEPSDLVGLPFIADGEFGQKVTGYAEPHWWPHQKKVLLFLDELDRCREDMQPIAMQLSLDRRAGGRNLPDGVIIVAACNGEQYMTSAIDQALMDRFAVVPFTPTVSEWLQWAESSNVNPAVCGFIRSNNKALDTPDALIGVASTISPTRRSWADLGYALNLLNKNYPDLTKCEQLALFSMPFVGTEMGLQFNTWVSEKFQVINAKDVFSGRAKADSLNILQVASVVEEIADTFCDPKRTKEEHGNCLRFFMAAGPEAFAALFSALPKAAAEIIDKFSDVDEYINKSVDILSSHIVDTAKAKDA